MSSKQIYRGLRWRLHTLVQQQILRSEEGTLDLSLQIQEHCESRHNKGGPQWVIAIKQPRTF
jgi:hypothetical protein